MMSYDFNTLLDDMKLPAHRALVAHWLDLYAAAGNRIPPLHGIDPLNLGKHLPDICILNHEGGNVFRFRLSGGNVNEFYGQDVRQKNLGDLVESPTRERLLDMAHAILHQPAAALHGLSSMQPQWNYSVALQRISLPLADADGVPRHIISATVFFRFDRDDTQSLASTDFQHRYRIPCSGSLQAPVRSAC
ncbi:PAS domain-containing protein [Ferrovibrio terrae]|uniref:PAS domain-containing protein n=1 Tax=Ferrovibrio terrae TaxID=2594003 RepID=UPI003137CB86